MEINLVEIQDKILEFLEPLSCKNFKLLDHPFDPTDETVRQVQIINVEYQGEKADSTTNARQGGTTGKRSRLTTLKYDISLWYKTSRKLNSRVVLPLVEEAINLIIDKNVFGEGTIGRGDIIFEGVDFDNKDSGDFFRYVINTSIKAVR